MWNTNERKYFEMDDAHNLADYISEMKKITNWKGTDQKDKRYGNQAGRPCGLRHQTQEIPVEKFGTRVCPGFESHSCQKTF